MPLAKPCKANTRAAAQANLFRPRYARWEWPVCQRWWSLESATKQRAWAVVGLFGVGEGSARGKIGRGTWETRGGINS